MNLDDAQRKKIASWITEGLKLSEIQNRITSELGVQMTYMDVRLLVDDLKLIPKDQESAKPVTPLAPSPARQNLPTDTQLAGAPTGTEPVASSKNVAVTVDQIARAGAVVSGKVTFTDGMKADWYFDQNGRLGLAAQQPGYRPPAADVQQFQTVLEAELSKLGL